MAIFTTSENKFENCLLFSSNSVDVNTVIGDCQLSYMYTVRDLASIQTYFIRKPMRSYIG